MLRSVRGGIFASSRLYPYNDWQRFRSQQQAWFRIGETGIENFMYSQNLQK